MKLKFQSPKGMHDILPGEQKYFDKIQRTVKKIAGFYNFKRIETPMLEETDLFTKGIGLNTDIVGKEMFSFQTKGGDELTLRPEGTASIIRAYLENGMKRLSKPVKLWYLGPFFRYEKPQFGRFRQFWQFGLEEIGDGNAARDAEIVQIFYTLLKKLKVKDLIVEVNSIGGECCRPEYIKLLTEYLKPKSRSLCSNCREKLKKNPLRILDCKEEKCQRVFFQAPQIIDHLCQSCHQHFKEFLEFLDEIKIPYRLNPRLVRGLDYYTRTVFEFFSTQDIKREKESSDDEKEEEGFSEPSRLALGGGGRYDNLVEFLGGKSTPAVGCACGMERIAWLMKQNSLRFRHKKKPKIFLAQLGSLAKRKSLKLMESFRKSKISVLESLGRDSLKAQLQIADKEGVRYVLILGHKEALGGTIMIRDMKTGKQEEIKMDSVIKEVKKKFKK